MPDLMRAADLVVTKAGPGTIAEAVATGIPLLLTGYLPGQETPNVDYVVRNGIGAYVPDPQDLPDTVVRLCADDSQDFARMRRRVTEIRPAHSAAQIAEVCSTFVNRVRDGEPRAGSTVDSSPFVQRRLAS